MKSNKIKQQTIFLMLIMLFTGSFYFIGNKQETIEQNITGLKSLDNSNPTELIPTVFNGYNWTEELTIIENVQLMGDLKTINDTKDNIHLFFLGKVDGTTGIYHKTLFFDSKSWSTLEYVTTAEILNYVSAIDVTIDKSDNIHLVYQKSERVYYRKCVSGIWSGEEQISYGYKPKIEIDLKGNPNIFFYSYNNPVRGLQIRKYNEVTSSWDLEVVLYESFSRDYFTTRFSYDFTIRLVDNLEVIDFYYVEVTIIYDSSSWEPANYVHNFYHIVKTNASATYSDPVNFKTYIVPYTSIYLPSEPLLLKGNGEDLHLFVNIPTSSEILLYYQRKTETGWNSAKVIASYATTNPNSQITKTGVVEPLGRVTIIWSLLDTSTATIIAQLNMNTYITTSGWSTTEVLNSSDTISKFPGMSLDSKGDAHLCWFEVLEEENIIKYRFGFGDWDGDWLSNQEELAGLYYPTNPAANASGFIFTDPYDPDSDDDQMLDGEEYYLGFDPLIADEDGDLMLDGWEYHNGLDPTIDDANDDLDSDLLLNIEEFNVGTLPNNNDTDDDQVSDYIEVKVEFSNPLDPDSDDDGLSDGLEINELGSNPLSIDSDNDTMDDYFEWYYNLQINVNDAFEDADADGLENIYEYQLDLHPQNPDFDSDLLLDGEEVYVYFTNPKLRDTDGDGLRDGREIFETFTNPLLADTDGDGLSDWYETYSETNATDFDSDDDLMSDGYEVTFGLDPLDDSDVHEDPDGDGLDNLVEYGLWTNPLSADTDGDRLYDNEEIVLGTDPTNSDTDGDLLSDYVELKIIKTDPLDADSDDDGLLDGEENLIYRSNPLKIDTDSDGLNDSAEVYLYNTNPIRVDTDEDELNDYEEITLGTDPLYWDSDFDSMSDGWEVLYGLNPLLDDTEGDADNDGVTNLREYEEKTNPSMEDTDQDNLSDYEEIFVYRTSPISVDSDNDLLNDYEELFVYQTSPLDPDSDDDRLIDGEEVLLGTNPLVADSDGDGISDGQEIKDGSDPLNPNNNIKMKTRNFVLIVVCSGIGVLLIYYLSPKLFDKLRRFAFRKQTTT